METELKTCNCESISEEEKLRLVDEIIDEYESKESNLIQILHMVQGLYGYLPLDLQKHIALKMKMPLSKISGVVSFYSLFTTEQKGEYVIKVCMGTACYVRGGKRIINRLKDLLGVDVGETTEDKKYTLEITRCIGACGMAPTMTINDKVHVQVNPDKLVDLLKELV